MYGSPKEAWAAVGGNKPYPTTLYQIELEPPRSPHQYVCDAIGLYEGESGRFWFGELSTKLCVYLDMETQYKEGIEKYLDKYPEFDMSQLAFIEESDKEAVLRRILKVNSLDASDPFRAWTKNPPDHIKRAAKVLPKLSYVEIVKEIYKDEAAVMRASAEQLPGGSKGRW
jgi:hypothetical protein